MAFDSVEDDSSCPVLHLATQEAVDEKKKHIWVIFRYGYEIQGQRLYIPLNGFRLHKIVVQQHSETHGFPSPGVGHENQGDMVDFRKEIEGGKKDGYLEEII